MSEKAPTLLIVMALRMMSLLAPAGRWHIMRAAA